MSKSIPFSRLVLSLLLILMIVPFGRATMVRANDSTRVDYDGNIQNVLAQIRKSQGAVGNADLECKKVTDSQFEALGEAVMAFVYPGPDERSMAERMAGGRGSQSLKLVYRQMGAHYLGCFGGPRRFALTPGAPWNDVWSDPPEGFLGTGAAAYSAGRGQPYYGRGGSMSHFWFGGFFMWIVIILAIGLVIYLIVAAGKPRGGPPAGETPLDILKKRYARGEISREEFDRMKKDLQDKAG